MNYGLSYSDWKWNLASHLGIEHKNMNFEPDKIKNIFKRKTLNGNFERNTHTRKTDNIKPTKEYLEKYPSTFVWEISLILKKYTMYTKSAQGPPSLLHQNDQIFIDLFPH